MWREQDSNETQKEKIETYNGSQERYFVGQRHNLQMFCTTQREESPATATQRQNTESESETHDKKENNTE